MAQEGVDFGFSSGRVSSVAEEGVSSFPHTDGILYHVIREGWMDSFMLRTFLPMHGRLSGLVLFFFRREDQCLLITTCAYSDDDIAEL
jgi:hypothetical protein